MRILIELPSWLGDSVMATPAIKNLLNYYDDSEVILIGSSLSIEVFKNNDKIFHSQVIDKSYLSLYKISRKLGTFDAFFSFRRTYRSKFLKLLILSKRKFQFNRKKYQNFHLVEKYNKFINESLKTNFKAGNLNINSNYKSYNKSSFPIIGINPGAKYGTAKIWYPEEYAKVAIELSSQYKILIFGSLNEKKIANEIESLLIKKGVSNYENLAGKTSISQLINIISSIDLFITGDSGPMHLAASFQIPSITIFGPTIDTETSQWMNKKSVVVKKNLDCQPCMQRVCPLKHHNCMKLIKANDILNAIDSLNLGNKAS